MDNRTELQALFKNRPYAYQERVCAELLAGHNVILCAPTGAGKTEAALGPYLLARQREDQHFPRRCIFASPMRTLAKDLHKRAKKVNKDNDLGLDVRLHTGEDPTSPELEGDIIITTVDQLLSNYLHVPYSTSWGGRNIGAGGVIASYVVLDEFHLFDPERAFRTALAMATALKGITPFLFMTATFSKDLTQKLAAETGAVVISPTPDELATMHSQQKTRTIQRVDATLSARAVVQAHQRRSIAIANTVDRVQTLYADLQRLQTGTELSEGEHVLHERLQGVTLEILHSRYFPAHRNEREERLAELLGEKSTKDVILVASQAVEVGLNISSEQLHTEVCPANSLLQRAGRNARFADEHGVVSVYALPTDEKGEWQTLPYKGQEKVIRATWKALEHLPEPITTEAERALIDAVHTAGDAENWRAYEAARHSTFRDKMLQAFEGDRSKRPDLIRDIQNVSLLLTDSDADLQTWDEVNCHERIGVTWVNFIALEANRKTLDPNFDSSVDWLAKVPREVEREKAKAEDIRQPTLLDWVAVTSPEQLKHETLVLINPKFVFYNRQEGFRWEATDGGTLGIAKVDRPPIHPRRNASDRPDYWYTYETYQEHIERVMAASRRVAHDVWHICPKVDTRFGLPSGMMELALKAAIAGHDIGKLSVGWQEWTRAWQAEQIRTYTGWLWNDGESKFKAKAQGKGEYCAHTDYHPAYDKARNRKMGPRPPHAGESAAVIDECLGNSLMDMLGDKKGLSVLKGILGAIRRHHGANATGTIKDWKLDKGAAYEAQRVFKLLTGTQLEAQRLEELQQHGIEAITEPELPTPDNDLAWIVYTLTSRALRLGDTRSFELFRDKEATS
ncbi:CRISPR-associated helicase Cas3' [Deinococcus alpinitundrae]|uniref:CRISPR-associated helicase Cas3' n=1 Tax=Deinococcus alpinitundrae TaxID=468913 RepID=UPI00137A5FDD|nr:CRISPR-associated helicase Cas3' [Deinococcus alpinitundrae]